MGITEYGVEFPVLCSRFLLVICFIYSSVYMSSPTLQFIPPLPYPMLGISLFFTSELCFVDKFICTLFLDSTYK